MTDQGWVPPEGPPNAPPPPPPMQSYGGGSGGWQPPPPPPPLAPSPPAGGWQPPPPPGGAGGWQPPPGGYPGGSPGTQKTEGLSTASLITGILSFVFFFVGPILAIVAIVTGTKGKKAIKASGGTKGGSGQATAGVVLGIVNLVISVLVIGLIAIGVAAASKHTRYTDLSVGDCYNMISSKSIFKGEVDKVDCTTAHDAEVTGAIQATDPGSYPGASGFLAQAQPRCAALGQQYVGGNEAAVASGLRVYLLYPNQANWDQGGRTLVCGVQNGDGSKHVGSVKG